MYKNQRFIALLGDGREAFKDQKLDEEMPTEPVVIDASGFSDAYRYDGFVFLNEDWFKKYSKVWRTDPTEIDRLLVNLVKYAVKDSESENLVAVKAYLAEPPEHIDSIIAVWRRFYEPSLRKI